MVWRVVATVEVGKFSTKAGDTWRLEGSLWQPRMMQVVLGILTEKISTRGKREC